MRVDRFRYQSNSHANYWPSLFTALFKDIARRARVVAHVSAGTTCNGV
jgi:hypothetical protein